MSLALLAVGLAMDATAVAAAQGAVAGVSRRRGALRIALLFGAFQGLMPLAGWFVGERFGDRVAAWDHWIAFALLVLLGARMIWGATRGDDAPAREPTWGALILLAVATSVDAMAAGLTLPLFGAPIAAAACLIGGVTAVLSGAAFLAGERLARRAGRWIEVVGGLMLIGVGVRVLVAHLA